jgi:hypothetical protein
LGQKIGCGEVRALGKLHFWLVFSGKKRIQIKALCEKAPPAKPEQE